MPEYDPDDEVEDDPDETFYDDPDNEDESDDEDDEDEEETWQVGRCPYPAKGRSLLDFGY